MADVTTVYPVVLGSVVAVLGLLLMWFRVQIATFFREERRRRGSANADSQTPGLAFAVGAAFFVAGAFIAVGTLAGWVHPQ
jgi:hypothetical protein